jgi:hypothetical protein
VAAITAFCKSRDLAAWLGLDKVRKWETWAAQGARMLAGLRERLMVPSRARCVKSGHVRGVGPRGRCLVRHRGCRIFRHSIAVV